MLAFSVHWLIITLKTLSSGYLAFKALQNLQNENFGIFFGLHLTPLSVHEIF
jgi:hypothetical protein